MTPCPETLWLDLLLCASVIKSSIGSNNGEDLLHDGAPTLEQAFNRTKTGSFSAVLFILPHLPSLVVF